MCPINNIFKNDVSCCTVLLKKCTLASCSTSESLRNSAVLLDINAAVLLQLMLMIQTNQFTVDAEPTIFLKISPI